MDVVPLLWRYLLRYQPRFAGRATRTELLLTFIATFAVLTLLIVLDRSIAQPSSGALLFPYLVTLVPLISVITRRFHDTNRRAWAWCVLITPYIGVFIFFGILMWDGEKEENIFGPDPRLRRYNAE
jgi:uncharacterized membrane protein YhaH (DUF805 family)